MAVVVREVTLPLVEWEVLRKNGYGWNVFATSFDVTHEGLNFYRNGVRIACVANGEWEFVVKARSQENAA